MQEFFEYLKSKGITQRNYPKKLYNLSDEQLKDLVINGIGIASISRTVDKNSNFNFVANDTLSGGIFPCAEIGCRIRNIDALARNAILYADTVFISNPFEKYIHVNNFNEYARYNLGIDLTLLYYVKPLLDEKIFQLSSSYTHVCKPCLKRMNVVTNRYLKKMEKAEELLWNLCLTDLEYKVTVQADSAITIEINGSEDILPHPMVTHWFNPPAETQKILGRKKKGKLNVQQVIDLGLADQIVNPIIEDLITQNHYSNFFSSYYLTHRNIDVKIINNSHNKSQSRLSEAMMDSLDHSLPFIPKTELTRLIQLRKKEGEAFQVYRSSLTNFLSNIKAPNYHLKEAFRDEIEPEIIKINQTIKTSKKLIISDIKKDLFVGSTYVSIGLFTHFLPANIGQLAAAAGGINYLDKFANSIKKLTNIESEVKANKYYFVWKMQKLIK